MQEQDEYRAEVMAHRKQWLEALRSGQYQQGQNFLHRRATNQYCCLGVACDLAGVAKEDAERRVYKQGEGEDELVPVTVFGSTDENDSVLPQDVMAWLGVLDNNPSINFPTNHGLPDLPGGRKSVAELNDRGWTFDQIAAAIEQYGFVSYDDALNTSHRVEVV